MQERVSYQSNYGVSKVREGFSQMVVGVGLSIRDGARNILPMAIIGAGVGAVKASFAPDLEYVNTMKDMAKSFVKAGFVIGKYDAVMHFPESVSLKSQLLSVLTDIVVMKSSNMELGTKAAAIMIANPITIDGAGKIFEGVKEMI